MPNQNKTCNFNSNVTAQFSGSGSSASLNCTGTGTAQVKMRLSWDDNPDDAGDAIDTISVLGQTWNSPGESGSVTNTVTVTAGNNYNLSFGGLQNNFKSVSATSIKMKDNDGNDTNAEFEIRSVTNNTFSESVQASINVPNNTIGSLCTTVTWGGSGGGTYKMSGPGANSTSSSGNESRCIGSGSNPCGGESPKIKTWTMKTTSPSGCVAEVSDSTNFYTDDNPTDNWTTSFINLEPNTQYDVELGTMSCVDMSTTVSASGSGNFMKKGNSVSGSKNYNNGDKVQLRFTSKGFNTNVSGETGEFGKTNSKTITVNFPSYSKTITVTTRAPKIRETFNYNDKVGQYPYEDIDLISNSPTSHLTTQTIKMNDIEIDMPFKVSNGNVQINVNGGGWQNTGSI